MGATYLIRAIDTTTGEMIALWDTVALPQVKYTRRLNDVGLVQISGDVLLTPNIEAVAAKDQLIEVLRFADGEETVEGTYIVRFWQRFEDEGRDWLLIAGQSLEYLLLQRVIDPRNDPLAAGGYSTKEGAADTVMTSFVNEQAGPSAATEQQVPSLTAATAAGTGETVRIRTQWANLLETLQGLTTKGRMDFYIERTSGIGLRFAAEAVGSDKTKTTNYPSAPFVLFSPEFGNMQEPDLTRDWKSEKTVVYLLGQGAGDSRDLHAQYASAASSSPYNYSVIVADARQIEDGASIMTEYQTQADDLLAQNAALNSFKFEITRAAEQYRVLWDLGDRVTAAWGDYEEDLRIVGVTVELTAGEERITPELEVAT